MECDFCGRKTGDEFCSRTCRTNKKKYPGRDVTRKYWLTKTFGRLRVDPSQELPKRWTPSTTQKFVFLCTCGKTKLCPMYLVSKGDVTTCGRCLERSKEEWLAETFGSLVLADQELPDAWSAHTTKKFVFQCKCGNTTTQKMNTVSSGLAVSCGKCSWRLKEYWLRKEFGRLRIVDTPDLPNGWTKYSEQQVNVLCLCGRTNTVTFGNLHRTASCGSCSVGVSAESKKVGKVLRTIFPDLQSEVKGIIPGARRIDFFSASHKIAIEYHGLIWHSTKTKSDPRRDYKKYVDCKKAGIRLVQIYNDDWALRREIFLDFLRKLVNPKAGRRRYNVQAVEITYRQAQEFLDQNHYLAGSKARGCLYVGLKSQDELVAVSVFGRYPKGIEWSRHAVKLGVRLWNPAGKCLDFAIQKLRPARVKSFSDNRLHTGRTYEALGFRNDGQTQHSYEYTDGETRRHKTAERVDAGVNERKTAAKKRLYRVYDSKKTRWLLDLTEQSVS